MSIVFYTPSMPSVDTQASYVRMLTNTLPLIALLLAATKGLPNGVHTPNELLGISHISDIAWTGRIEEGGELMSFTGRSLQHIEAQIQETSPAFSWSDTPKQAASNNSIKSEGDTICDVQWNLPFASVFHIRQGISYLRKIHGNCTNGSGPGNCSRVSCSWSSGIWFCNDNPYPMSVPCSTFGDRAWDIIENCYASGELPEDAVHGQIFDTDGWNVIVGGVHC
ncbi:hypothetical protein GGR55DRAFT_369661 [Xylaria sp. FL0064]|nr:hypothetical protein GGR55DRAFT_369661 [Xylaria sp. FL0064]